MIPGCCAVQSGWSYYTHCRRHRLVHLLDGLPSADDGRFCLQHETKETELEAYKFLSLQVEFHTNVINHFSAAMPCLHKDQYHVTLKLIAIYIHNGEDANIQHVAQLLQRDHTAGWVSFGQKWTTGMGRQYFCGYYRSFFNHCNIIGQQSNWIWWQKCKIMAVTPFKVGINRKPIC